MDAPICFDFDASDAAEVINFDLHARAARADRTLSPADEARLQRVAEAAAVLMSYTDDLHKHRLGPAEIGHLARLHRTVTRSLPLVADMLASDLDGSTLAQAVCILQSQLDWWLSWATVAGNG